MTDLTARITALRPLLQDLLETMHLVLNDPVHVEHHQINGAERWYRDPGRPDDGPGVVVCNGSLFITGPLNGYLYLDETPGSEWAPVRRADALQLGLALIAAANDQTVIR